MQAAPSDGVKAISESEIVPSEIHIPNMNESNSELNSGSNPNERKEEKSSSQGSDSSSDSDSDDGSKSNRITDVVQDVAEPDTVTKLFLFFQNVKKKVALGFRTK